MSAQSHQHLDGLILSFAKEQLRKVAMIISKVRDECRHRGVDTNCHDIAQRIRVLVEGGQLEAQGDLAAQRGKATRLGISLSVVAYFG